MATYQERVAASADDGDKNDTYWTYSSNQLSLGRGGESNDLDVAVRFINVDIAQGTTIASAKITFTQDWSWVGSDVESIIYGIDEDNTANFTSDPTGRSKTSNSKTWDFNDPGDDNTVDTVDISDIVQEIVDRGSWSSGNAMGFIVENDTTTEKAIAFYSYDGNSSNAPLLTITTVGATTTSTTTSTTTTTTSTTTTSTTTLPWEWQKDRGMLLKVSKPGLDASTSNPDNFLLHSSYPQLQIYKTGFFSNTFTNDGTYEVDHNLGYKPFALGYMQWYDGITDAIKTDFRLLDWSIQGASYEHYTRMEIGKNQLVFYVADTNLERFVTLKGYYIIFKNPIDRVRL